MFWGILGEIEMRANRHSSTEIVAKLRQAEEMAENGSVQTEIAKALGISVMTFHRWRKWRAAQLSQPLPPASQPQSSALIRDPIEETRIRVLEQENSRLRRLVADLMLEKVELEEALQRSAVRRAAE
jgi:transposase-like protein